MAKKIIKFPKHQTGRVINTKTPYGTTSEMIVTDDRILSQVSLNDNLILCKDDQGYYATTKDRIDTGLVDQLRCSDGYRESLNINIKDE